MKKYFYIALLFAIANTVSAQRPTEPSAAAAQNPNSVGISIILTKENIEQHIVPAGYYCWINTLTLTHDLSFNVFSLEGRGFNIHKPYLVDIDTMSQKNLNIINSPEKGYVTFKKKVPRSDEIIPVTVFIYQEQ